MSAISNLIINMIARTAGFTNGMDKAKKSVYEFQKAMSESMQSVQRIVGLGIIGRLVTGVVNGMTEMDRAMREGRDGLSAFTQAIPLVGDLEKAFENMYAQLSGFNYELKAFETYITVLEKRKANMKEMGRSLELLNNPDKEKELKALYKYQDALEEIKNMQESLRLASLDNPDLVWMSFGEEKRMALKLYRAEIEKINDAYKNTKIIGDAVSNTVWEIQKGILNQIDDIKNKIAGMSDEMVNMLSRMRDAGAPVEDIQKTIQYVRELEKIQEEYNRMKEAGDIKPASDADIIRRINPSYFQEIRMSLVDLPSLNPQQDPMLDKANVQIQQGYQQIALLARIANGGIS